MKGTIKPNIKLTGNEPAMPFVAGDQNNPDDRAICEGLTIRQHFAAMAMQGYIAGGGSANEAMATFSVMAADALIKELNKENG